MPIIRALSKNKKIRAYYVDAKNATAAISNTHTLNEYASDFVAETAVGTILLSADINDESSKYSAIIKSDEPKGSAVIIRTAPDTIKGYSTINTEKKYNFKTCVRNKAEFTAIIDIGTKSPYITRIAVDNDSMQACIEFYLEQSQQQKSIVRMSPPEKAIGVLVQPVLNSEFEYITVRQMEIEHMLDKLLSADAIESVKEIFITHGFDVTEEYELKAECDCNELQMENVILSIGKKGAYEIVRDMGSIEITCPYCLKKYNFDYNAVEDIFRFEE